MYSLPVIIANANEEMLNLMTRSLKGFGYHNLIAAKNGLEALNAANKTTPALIVCDVNMPTIDGWQLCRILRTEDYMQRFGRVPILLISHAFVDPRAQQMAFDVGASAFLQAPFKESHFARVVQTLLKPDQDDGGKLRFNKRRALVVDSDEDEIELLRFALHREGYDLMACDASDAVETAEREEPNLILLDYGPDAEESLKTLKSLTSTVHENYIVVMSPNTSADFLIEIMKCGAVDCLKKPVEISHLIESVNRAWMQQRYSWVAEQFYEQVESTGRLELLTRKRRAFETIKNDFLAVIEEKFGESLDKIKACAKRMEELAAGDRAKEVKDNLECVAMATEAMERLAIDIKDAAQIGSEGLSLEAAVFPLSELSTSVFPAVEILARERDLNVKFAMEDAIGEMVADRALIKQAVYMMATSILKMFEGPAPIQIEIRAANQKDVPSSMLEEGMFREKDGSDLHSGLVQILIRQNDGRERGDSCKNIFDYLSDPDSPTTRRESLGIGLTYAQSIIRQHGGALWTETRKGKGRQFVATIPRSLPEEMQIKADAEGEAARNALFSD